MQAKQSRVEVFVALFACKSQLIHEGSAFANELQVVRHSQTPAKLLVYPALHVEQVDEDVQTSQLIGQRVQESCVGEINVPI